MPEQKKKKLALLEESIIRLTKLLESTERKSYLSGWFRFSVFAGGIALYFILYFASLYTLSIISASLFVLLFITASIIQSRFISHIDKQKKWINIKKGHIARIRIDWQNLPHFKNFEDEVPSILEADLDITGGRSLHRLIDYSKSKEGSALLRKLFITTPAGSGEILNRQKIISELNHLSHFREKFLLTLETSSGKELNGVYISQWLLKEEEQNNLKKTVFYVYSFFALHIVSVFLIITGIIPALFVFIPLIYFGVYLLNQRKVIKELADAEFAGSELKKVIRILSFIENYNFGGHTHLERLAVPLKKPGMSPSAQLNKLNFYLDTLTLRNNPFLFIIIMLLFPFDYYFAYLIDRKKRIIGANINGWLETWHSFEAFVSLSVFSTLNPEYTFPHILPEENNNKILLKTEDAGHPLIPAKDKICNDYSISGNGSISIITGSNMSGKSTFLRTLGINTCLAYAGAPVNASSFTISLMRLFTCIKVSDSVIDGISYFYAEVKRLKLLLDEIDAGQELPVFYLIDEIFKGTNNIERLKGSRALIKTLTTKPGAGLVSTHDLELIKLADENSLISNYHFKEEIDGGKMAFNYKLHTGPCPTTNALIIMKNNGLPVD